MMTTIALNTGVTAGGTPRKVIVEVSVWMMNTPTTVPGERELAAGQRGAAEHDREDRIQLDVDARRCWRRRP